MRCFHGEDRTSPYARAGRIKLDREGGQSHFNADPVCRQPKLSHGFRMDPLANWKRNSAHTTLYSQSRTHA